MRIQLLSDLHLEVNIDFQPEPAPGADLLVLAGDIGSYQARSLLPSRGDEHFGLGRFSPKPQFASWPTPVAFLPGNHEFDGLDVDETQLRLRRICDELGIIWLDQQDQLIGDVRFIGDTLWSDFDSVALHEASLGAAHQWQERHKAFSAANHYLAFVEARRHGEVLLAPQVRELALECQAWLHAALQKPKPAGARKTVVVTHFAPSLKSADPRFGINPGTAGFCNALDDWLPLTDFWLHGHVHCAHDYTVGDCRVVCNPLGYASKGEQVAFEPLKLIEV